MPVQETFGKNDRCSVCNMGDIDTLNFGEIHARKELTVHLFCLLFSKNLSRRGLTLSCIAGFELKDIRQLSKNCVEVNCCYCGNGSATTYCEHPNCDRVFHQVCGYKNNARFEYLDNFRSFCDTHNFIIEDENLVYPEINGCWICYEALGEYHSVTTVPSCCDRWFHQQCLRQYAVNAGMAFMCPLCRNKNFTNFAQRHGIYVPDREALWEETHDFTDIERFYKRCDANNCICPKGRLFSSKKWTIQLCSCCGSYGLHKLCRSSDEREKIIICDNCHRNEQPKSSQEDAETDVLGDGNQ